MAQMQVIYLYIKRGEVQVSEEFEQRTGADEFKTGASQEAGA